MILNASKIAIALESHGIQNTQGFYRRLNNFLIGHDPENLSIKERQALKKVLSEEVKKLTAIL